MAEHTGSKWDIDERTLRFACDVIRFVREVRCEPGIRGVIEQLAEAAGSIGANRDEASAASSRREFIRFNEIALRSAKESRRWLRICVETDIGPKKVATELHKEADEIARILAAIVIRAKSSTPQARSQS